MTTAEMIQNFHLGYDIANLEGPGYEDEEILVFLNSAQIIEVMKEVSIKRWTYISKLIVNDILSTLKPAWSDYNYHTAVTPSEDYIAYVTSKSKISRVGFKVTNGDEWVGNILIRKEQQGKYIYSTLNHVILIVPRVYEEENGTISILYDEHTTFTGTDDFALEYIKRPIDIEVGVDCEINEILHERIVNTAIDLGKKVWNPQEAGVSEQTDQLQKQPE